MPEKEIKLGIGKLKEVFPPRKFNGRSFFLRGSYGKKNVADEMAQIERDNGRLARVTKKTVLSGKERKTVYFVWVSKTKPFG